VRTGKRQGALYTKARSGVHALVTLATNAAAKGALNVPLAPLEAAAAAVLSDIS
jgi:hypothetical protein